MSSASSSQFKLKLLINKENEKVLFAEASKEFVDFLCSLMCLPLGQVVNLLKKNRMVGCIGNLYESIESLGETYLPCLGNLKSVLNPKTPMVPFRNPLLLCNNDFVGRKEVYMCLYHSPFSASTVPSITYHPYFAHYPVSCPICRRTMTYKLQFVDSPTGGGFVEGVATYMVMDNLEVKAMSAISGVALINSFNVKDLGSVEEKLVDVGVEEGLKILKLSLQSKDVLTRVFLRNLQGA